ncbi:MAG: hypothetical protein WKF81_01850, partial [Thermomicrobiales bacterium]
CVDGGGGVSPGRQLSVLRWMAGHSGGLAFGGRFCVDASARRGAGVAFPRSLQVAGASRPYDVLTAAG